MKFNEIYVGLKVTIGVTDKSIINHSEYTELVCWLHANSAVCTVISIDNMNECFSVSYPDTEFNNTEFAFIHIYDAGLVTAHYDDIIIEKVESYRMNGIDYRTIQDLQYNIANSYRIAFSKSISENMDPIHFKQKMQEFIAQLNLLETACLNLK